MKLTKDVLVDDAHKFLTWYSIQAALTGGALMAGLGALHLAGIDVSPLWSDLTGFLVCTSFVALRLVKQDKTATPDLPGGQP